MNATNWRRDKYEGSGGVLNVVYGLLMPGLVGPIRQAMVLLYNLADRAEQRPIRYKDGMTHEFTLYEVDPDTPIDFGKSMFLQKQLSPLTPATVAYQFVAATDEVAIERLDGAVRRLVAMTLPHDFSSAWDALFAEGVDVTKALMEVVVG